MYISASLTSKKKKKKKEKNFRVGRTTAESIRIYRVLIMENKSEICRHKAEACRSLIYLTQTPYSKPGSRMSWRK